MLKINKEKAMNRRKVQQIEADRNTSSKIALMLGSFVAGRSAWMSQVPLNSKTVSNTGNKSVLEWFLKDHMILKTGVTSDEILLLGYHKLKLNFQL